MTKSSRLSPDPGFAGSDINIISSKKATPKKPAPKAQTYVFASHKSCTAKSTARSAAKGTATTASDYFGDSKPRRSNASRGKSVTESSIASPKSTSGKLTINGKDNTPKKRQDDFEDADNDDDIFSANYKKGRHGDDYESDPFEAEEEVAPRPKVRGRGKQSKVKEAEKFMPEDDDVDMEADDDDFVVPDDDEMILDAQPAKAKKSTRKRKSTDLEDEDEDEMPKKGKRKSKSSAKSTPAKPKPKKPKKEEKGEDATIQAILDDIPLVRAPTPPPREDGEKWNFHKYAGNKSAAPTGSKDAPEGAENCLAGLSFVFTGILESLSRDDGIALVKRYGGKVMGAPSKNTSYVVLGSDAGPSKLKKIQENKLKTINEDGLFALISKLPANGGDGKAGEAYEKKKKAEAEKAQKLAEEMAEAESTARKEREEREKKQKKLAAQGKAPAPKPKTVPESSKLWTVRYAPSAANQLVGNKTQVERLAEWLRNFPKRAKMGFKLAGPNATGTFRAVMIHGPPGVGKTTAAHLIAKLEGYDIVESNASDTRSKKLIEDTLKGVLNTTSLLGYFAGDGKDVTKDKKKLCLIMDEVDGMSAGDRGGVGALAALCKKTQIPMILICNDRKLPKMKPFDHVVYDMPFRRPTTDQIRSRIMTIAFREGMKMSPPVINALIEGTGADIRQVVNMVSTVKLDNLASMDFDQGKEMSKAWEKHTILKPWDITSKILGGGMFAASSKATLNDKAELYFNDHEFSFLMLQENYLKTQPIQAADCQGAERRLKVLELTDNAASSISDGDLVDRLIHGSQQQWSMMPTHAMFSFVKPASYISGTLGYGNTSFTSWLGNNSKQMKLSRMVKEIQGHMRLRSNADRHNVRQEYVPLYWNMLPKRLEREGKAVVPEIIDFMDSYFLTRDDFDAVVELGVGNMAEDNLKIDAQTKSAFTRQ